MEEAQAPTLASAPAHDSFLNGNTCIKVVLPDPAIPIHISTAGLAAACCSSSRGVPAGRLFSAEGGWEGGTVLSSAIVAPQAAVVPCMGAWKANNSGRRCEGRTKSAHTILYIMMIVEVKGICDNAVPLPPPPLLRPGSCGGSGGSCRSTGGRCGRP